MLLDLTFTRVTRKEEVLGVVDIIAGQKLLHRKEFKAITQWKPVENVGVLFLFISVAGGLTCPAMLWRRGKERETMWAKKAPPAWRRTPGRDCAPSSL